MPPVAAYSAYVNEILRVSDLYRSAMRHAPKGQPMARQGTSETMDWELTRAAVATPTQSGQKKRRARWVSQEEMEKRRQEGHCFRCGTSGYEVNGYEFLLPCRSTEAGPARGSWAASGKSTLIEPQLESKESGPEDNSRTEELN